MKKLIVLLSLNILIAQVPNKISFQAYLTDANNMPVAAGSYEITFRSFDASADGNKLWEETQTVNVDGSVVSTMLGNTVPLVALNSAAFLEIQLKDEVLSPRQELGGTMFAIKAVNADTAKFVDLSGHRGLIRSVRGKNASLTAFSTDADSDSYLALIGQDKDGNQKEIRIVGDGDKGEYRFYDATRNKYLMTLDSTGSLTATNFVGDGSQLTGIEKTTDTDDQTLSISGDTLYISEGNFALLSAYKDNTDTQDLSFDSSTKVFSLTDGGTVDLSGLSSSSGASSLNGLTDVLVESNSMYVGNDPSATTTSDAKYNVAIGAAALGKVTSGDENVAVGYNALFSNTTGDNNSAIG